MKLVAKFRAWLRDRRIRKALSDNNSARTLDRIRDLRGRARRALTLAADHEKNGRNGRAKRQLKRAESLWRQADRLIG